MKLSGLALLGAAAFTGAQHHNHAHRHPARHGSPLEGRDAITTTTVPGPVVTVYELNGQLISADDVEKGLAEGVYVLVGDKITTVAPASTSSTSSTTSSPTPTTSSTTSTSTSTTPSSTSTSAPATSSSAVKLLEAVHSSTKATSTYVAATTSTKAAATTSATASSSSSDTSSVSKEFPSGELDCTTFPSAYGAVAADWLGLGGWTGVQETPDYSTSDSTISYIETAVSGSSCTSNSFCSYACPAGYQKSQWPTAQGSTGQSIGGLYCNSDGKLELSRSTYKQICTAGTGGITATNKLSKNVAVCRTDYPGTESETVPLNVAAGATAEVTCPDASTYYTWEGSATSAQYYVNPSGYSIEEACQWGTAGSNIGNWAPVNIGVGKGTSGETFISLFPNSPTNTDGVLDFDITITGDVSGKCSYSSGKYYSNGDESSTGCTVSVSGDAVFEFS